LYLNHDVYIETEAVIKNFNRITNLVYKLLPLKEEEKDWQKLLENLIIELEGMNMLLIDQHDLLFQLLCKMKGLFKISSNFELFRRTIFDCLNLLGKIKDNVCA